MLNGTSPVYSGTRVDVSRKRGVQVDTTIKPVSPATRGPRRTIFVRWGEETGLRRWGGGSGDPAQNSTGHSNTGSAL